MQPGRPPPRKRMLEVSVMKSQLQGEIRKFMEDNPALNIMGPKIVCQISAKFISVLEDMDFKTNLKNEFVVLECSYT